MDPRKLPASLVAALSLAAQGCIATTCLSVVKDDTDSGATGHTGVHPCLAPIVDHTGVGPCLLPPLDHTGSTGSTGGTGASGGSGATTTIDRGAVLERLPPDVRARVGG